MPPATGSLPSGRLCVGEPGGRIGPLAKTRGPPVHAGAALGRSPASKRQRGSDARASNGSNQILEAAARPNRLAEPVQTNRSTIPLEGGRSLGKGEGVVHDLWLRTVDRDVCRRHR